ncbi:MAG: bifunctional oligoribonuclease/PAP phosphatase NrnA [Verrucomicrobiales bacterium]|nr:bifunctional oligoribonuclease/PAP phosphatase NrnA [Verrucomicrobiales bacterium]
MQSPAADSFSAIRDALAAANHVAVISHDRPDGDAIGSTVALTRYLLDAGHEVTAWNFDEVPEALQFLPNCGLIQKPDPASPVDADLVVSLDAAGIDRIHLDVWNSFPDFKKLINIDHHVSNTRFGDLVCVEETAPATGEIIFDLIEFLAGTDAVTTEMAANLYAAISTDTGSFRYPNTTAKTYRIGAALIEAGADVGKLNQQLYESYPLRRVELLRELLQAMRIDFDGRCASVQLTLDTIQRLGIESGDTEGLIDIIRAIDSVVVAVFFEELPGPEGKIRVSSRSKDPSADVGKICGEFGGGGHTLAAGTRMKGPLDEAVDRFLAEVKINLP